MQTELLSLSKTFTEHLFRIPDYQRGYSWQTKQLKELWNDITQLEKHKNHYTGVLTLEAVSSKKYEKWDDDKWVIEAKKFRPYYIVDGQQRLTTTLILIQTIIETMSDGDKLNYDSKEEIQKRYIYLTKDSGISKSYIFGYEKDNPSYEFLKTEIFLNESDDHSTSEETIYTHNLINAKHFFKKKIETLNKEQIESLYTKITHHLLFNVFTIAEGIDVFVTFETMNNRGKTLSHLELLKNRLIYLSTKFDNTSQEQAELEKDKLRKTINESWKTTYHYLGKNKERPLNDDFFLFIHFCLSFTKEIIRKEKDYPEQSDINLWHFKRNHYFKDYLLDEVFAQKNIYPESENDLKITINSIYDFAIDLKNSVKIFYEIFNPKDSKLSTDEIILLDKICRLEPDEETVLLVALYKKRISRAKRIEALAKIERYMLLSAIRRLNYDTCDLTELGILFMNGKKSIDEVIGTINEDSERHVNSQEFLEAIKSIGKSGHYNWKGIRYFLFEYEQHLKEQTKSNRDKITWAEYNQEDYAHDFITIEHIYPQKAAHQEWQKHFNQYSVKQRNVLKHCIGNLVPLSKPKNSSLGNRPFSEKKGSKDKKTGYAYGSYSEIEVSHNENWTPELIKERSLTLLNFMEKRWGITLGNDEEKIKIIGLDFIAQ